MTFPRYIVVASVSVFCATSGFAENYKKDRAETVDYTLTEGVHKAIEGGGDEVTQLTNLLFRDIHRVCQLDASVGRCGCTMNGFQASCQMVLACLNAGFCVAVK